MSFQFLFVLVIQVSAHAFASQIMCEKPSSAILKKAEVAGQPNYFFKISEDGSKVFYASNEGNWLYDFDKKLYYPIPGNQDAVPMGKDFVTTPKFSPDNKKALGLEFYRVEDILRQNGQSKALASKKKESIQPSFVDSEMKGMYQSTAALSQDEFRILTDENGLTIRDYKVNSDGKINPKTTPKKICQNYIDELYMSRLKLPMLSKDGAMVSVLDTKSSTSKILKINGDTCEEVANLERIVAKADFSYDSKSIVFHVESKDEFIDMSKTGYQANRTTDGVLHQLYIYNIDTKDFKKVAFDMREHPYYPVFTRDGNILANSIRKEKGKDKSSFTLLNPRLENSSEKFDAAYFCANRTQQIMSAISVLYLKICTDLVQDTTVKTEFALSQNLSKKQCEDLVSKKWKAEIKTLQVEMNKSFDTTKRQAFARLRDYKNPEELQLSVKKSEDLLANRPVDLSTIPLSEVRLSPHNSIKQ